MTNLLYTKGSLFLVGLIASVCAFAQSVKPVSSAHKKDMALQKDTVRPGISIRTNLLWDAAAEPNLGIEYPVLKHFSLGMDAGFKSWPRWFLWDTDNINNPRHWRNFAVVPEIRFYPRSVYEGPFIGLDFVYTHFNVGNVTFPLGLYKDVRDHRLQGDFWGPGLFAGWSWWIGRHWRLEAQAGAALGWASYKRYHCEHCGEELPAKPHLAVVPKLGLNLAWNSAPREVSPDCNLPIPLKDIRPLPEVPVPVLNPGEFHPRVPENVRDAEVEALIREQKDAYDKALKAFEDYQAALARWEDLSAQNHEIEEWNAMARQHNQAVQECLNKQKKNK